MVIIIFSNSIVVAVRARVDYSDHDALFAPAQNEPGLNYSAADEKNMTRPSVAFCFFLYREPLSTCKLYNVLRRWCHIWTLYDDTRRGLL